MSITTLANVLRVPEQGLKDLIEKYFGLENFKPIDRKHIFICGGKQHGKSTLAGVIKSYDPSGVEVVSFAETLKRIAEMFGVKDDDSEDKDTTYIKHLKMFKRKVYQIIGTEIGRSLDVDVWIRLVDNMVFMLPQQYHTIVYPDMRFTNELLYARQKNNYSIVKIIRPNYTVANDTHHTSESFYSTFISNYEIINDGTLQQYLNKCITLCKEIGM